MTAATAIAVFALVVSLLTAWVLLHAQREVVRSETVTSIFEGFRRLAELRSFFWQVAHAYYEAHVKIPADVAFDERGPYPAA